MSLHYLNPQQYYRIVNLMQSKRSEREGYIADAISTLKQTLDSLGIKYEFMVVQNIFIQFIKKWLISTKTLARFMTY